MKSWTLSEGYREVKPKVPTERAYEWFLELPVAIVLAILWFAGAVLVGLCALALYSFGLLLRAVGGA